MASFSVSYLHDDRFVTRAVRESWWPPARRRAALHLLWFALAAAAVLVAAESLPGSTPSAAMRVIMLAPVALLLAGMAGMGLVLLLPRWLQRRLRRLPDRTVRVTFDDDGLDYATAHERYRAVWGEVQALDTLESMWRLRLRSGAQLVLPFAAAGPELSAWLTARTTSIGSA